MLIIIIKVIHAGFNINPNLHHHQALNQVHTSRSEDENLWEYRRNPRGSSTAARHGSEMSERSGQAPNRPIKS